MARARRERERERGAASGLGRGRGRTKERGRKENRGGAVPRTDPAACYGPRYSCKAACMHVGGHAKKQPITGRYTYMKQGPRALVSRYIHSLSHGWDLKSNQRYINILTCSKLDLILPDLSFPKRYVYIATAPIYTIYIKKY